MTTAKYPSKQSMSDAILACYYSSSVQERIFGRSWYAQAKDIALALSEAYALDFDIACAVLAVLSPRNQWNRNVDDAIALIKRYRTNQDYDSVKVCTFKANKDKAILILETRDIAQYLKGLKVNAFYECIRQGGITNDAICIDGHAVSIALGEKISLKNIPGRYFNPKGYGLVSEAYKHACKAINNANEYKTELLLFPCQLQAITWVHHRAIHLNAYITDQSDSEVIDAKIERIRKSNTRKNEKDCNG